MAERDAEPVDAVDTKRGHPIYDRNPSVPPPSAFGLRSKRVRLENEKNVMIIGKDDGEVLGEGHAGFFQNQEVDEAQFVKLYLAGMKQTTKLTAAGLKVFSLLYQQMRASPQKDRLDVNYYIFKKLGGDLSIQSFRRGLRELLDNQFLYRSPVTDAYFVNVDFIFNGNRITLAKSYHLKPASSGSQLALALEPAPLRR